VAEATVVVGPVPPGLGELLAAAPDEVPPHKDGLGKGHAAQQQRPRRGVHLEAALVPAQPEVGRTPGSTGPPSTVTLPCRTTSACS
jgi:hypothetical protein